MKKILFFVFIVTNILNAQHLNLDECIHKALRTHPDIQKYSIEVKITRSEVDVAKADYLPQITMNVEYDPIHTYTYTSNGVFNTKDSEGLYIGGVINQKIWDFSKTTSNILAKELKEDMSTFNLADAKALLAYKVKLQYELMLVQKVAIDVREKDLKAKEALYNQAEAFVKNGMKTTADASRFLASVFIAKEDLAISRASYEKAKTLLSLYINEPISNEVTQDNTLETNIQILPQEQTILNASPLLSSVKKSIEQNKLNYKASKASHYGSIDATASYTNQNTLNEYNTYVIGIKYQLPLYSGGRTSALVEQSRLNTQNLQATLNSQKLALKEEFNNLLIDIDRCKKTIEAKKSQLIASKQTQTLLEARYKEGLATYIEILDASALKVNAELGLLQAIYEKSSAIHRIEYLQGKSI
ncbi:MAG: outer membrane protein TolC [Sulfurimonas sp.]|jgi:outer membrane protein TolC